MKKEDLRIVFMGTPGFAVESLRALVEGGYHVVGVVTMPDKAVGRHASVLQPSPVKQYALSAGLPVLQPERLKDESFLSALRAMDARLQIVVAFRMLPEVVWNMPPEGTFNLHASLLPHYRGAAPVNWAIIRGEKQTGVTTFFLTHEIDAGKIILQRALPVADTDDAGVLHDALMTAGARLVTETVDLILSGRTVETIPQETLCLNPAALQPAPKIFKDTCRIDWNQPVKKVYDFIRGLSPYPAAWTELVTPDGKRQMLKIFHTSPTSPQPLPEGEGLPPSPCGEGTGVRLISDGKSYIDIALPDGCLRILSLQLTGKKRMSAPDFLAGFRQAITSCTVN